MPALKKAQKSTSYFGDAEKIPVGRVLLYAEKNLFFYLLHSCHDPAHPKDNPVPSVFSFTKTVNKFLAVMIILLSVLGQ